jgi:HAD superfamily phosphoserine phosphatase-like hydrolase
MSDHSDKLALFDFDGTLYKHDSILSFCFFYYQKKPQRTWRFIKQVFYWLLWKFKRINTSEFKSRFICFIEGDNQIEVERIARLFWENNTSFNSEILLELKRCQAENLCVVVVSASPDLFILPACEKLGIQHVVSTTLRIHEEGYTLGTNCRGSEKTIRLRAVFPTQRIVRAYSDNTDDLQLLRTAEQGFLVKNGAIRSVPNVGDFH